MKTNRQTKLFLLVLFSSLFGTTPTLYGQSYGSELINNGTFQGYYFLVQGINIFHVEPLAEFYKKVMRQKVLVY